MKRSVAAGLVVAAIVVGGGVGWGVSRINHHDKAHKSTRNGPAPVRIINFVTKADEFGVALTKPSQVDRLTGTSPEFKQFMTTTVQKLIDTNTCPGAALEVSVSRYATSGYAIGGVNQCGGYAAIWGVKNGAWKELIGTQDIWYCAQLHSDGVPKGLISDGKCYDQATKKVIQYQG